MKQRDVFELVAGTTLFLFTLVVCVMIANKITHLLNPSMSRSLNIVILCVHLIMIVSFVIILRGFFHKYIKNKDILNSIFTLTGPIIALSSLYMSDTLRGLVNI